MFNQSLVKILSSLYSFIALPALAIIGIMHYRRHHSTGSTLFALGAVATAAGSLFNNLFPYMHFLSRDQYSLPQSVNALMAFAFMIHLLGFCTMVAGLGIITFREQ